MIRISSSGEFQKRVDNNVSAYLDEHGYRAAVLWNFGSVKDAFNEAGYNITDTGIDQWFKHYSAILSHLVATEAARIMKTLVQVDIVAFEAKRVENEDEEGETDGENN